MLKIGLVNFNGYLGGGETLFRRLADHLTREDYEVICFVSKEGYLSDYYTVNSDKSVDVWVTFNMEALRWVYWQVGIQDILHLELHVYDRFYHCQSLLNKLIVHFGHGKRRFLRGPNYFFNKFLYKSLIQSNRLVVMSATNARLLLKDFGSSSLPIIPLAIEKRDMLKLQGDACAPSPIVWLGRLVDFKTPSLIYLLDMLLLEGRSRKVIIIGEGAAMQLVQNHGYSKLGLVEFMGVLSVSDIGSLIPKNAIGYAMATSALELASLGMPVIVALASQNLSPITSCGGLLSEVDLGELGGQLNDPYLEMNLLPSLLEVIEKVELDYDMYSKDSKLKVCRDYSMEVIIKQYIDLIKSV